MIMYRKVFKKVVGVAATSLLAATMLMAPTQAFAADKGKSVGGGLGGGPSGGRITSNFAWHSISGENAFDRFMSSVSNMSPAGVKRQVSARVKGGLDVCKKSNTIWWVASGSKWVYNFNDPTYGDRWNHNAGSIDSPAKSWGNAPSRAEVNAFKKWDKLKNGNKLLGDPGYTIICSGSFGGVTTTTTEIDKPLKAKALTERTECDFSHEELRCYSTEETYTNVANYTYLTSVDPMRIDGRYPGDGPFEAQSGSPAKTEYGKIWDSISGGTSISPNEVGRIIDSKIAYDRSVNTTSSKVSLSANNRKAMARGGILNVKERTTKAKIYLHRKDSNYETRSCSYTRLSEYDSWVKTCTPWRKAYTKKGITEVVKTKQTPELTGFWQLLSTHCNQKDFGALVSATGATVLNSGDPSNKISAVARSRKYNSIRFDFGNPHNSNAAAAKSGHMGFYDKECPFACTANRTGPGASSANDAINNSGTNGKTDGRLNGGVGISATGKKVRGNYFQYFRDNVPRDLNVDTWYPVSGGVVNYGGEAPVSTTITRWSEGTPGVNTTSGGKFIMKSKNGGATLFGTGSSVGTQKNWDTAPANTPTATIIPGLHNRFTVQSTWASEKNKPQVFNFKWEYAPQVSTTVPTLVGLQHKGYPTTAFAGNPAATQQPIQGKCYANFGTNGSSDTTDIFYANTGSGTANGLDGSLVDGNIDPNSRHNLLVRFVRATTE